MKVTRRQWKWIVTALVLLAIGLVYFTREPRYGGAPLSRWIETAHIKGEKGWVAVNHIGTNGIPYLLKWMEYKPLSWNVRLKQWKQKWPWLPVFKENDRGGAATRAFIALGTNGAPAIPRLIEFAQSTNGLLSARGTDALFFIGVPAIPALARIAADSNAPTSARGYATRGLCALIPVVKNDPRFVTNEALVASALIGNLEERDMSLAAASAAALSYLPRQASISVPALTNALRMRYALLDSKITGKSGSLKDPKQLLWWSHTMSRDAEFREALIRSLMQIQPEALKGMQKELVAAANDGNVGVRDAATNALMPVAPEALENVGAIGAQFGQTKE